MTPRDLLAVAIAAMAIWFISISVIGLLAPLLGPFTQLAVGFALMALAVFVVSRGPLLR